MYYLANKELTLRNRQRRRTLRNLRPRLCSCLVKRWVMERNGIVEQTSKMNQVDRYLQTKRNKGGNKAVKVNTVGYIHACLRLRGVSTLKERWQQHLSAIFFGSSTTR